MGRIERKVDELLQQDPSMRASLEFLLDHDGPITWNEASGELSSGEWGRFIEKGILTDADAGFELADPEEVEAGLSEETDDGDDVDHDSSWSRYDKLAGLAALGMMAGYAVTPIGNAVGGTFDILLGPVQSMLPFYGVILVLAVLTGLTTSLLQANLMNTEVMAKYQEQMQSMQDRRKDAKERGDDEELERIQEEQMEAMGDNIGMFKEQFRPMVWTLLVTIPAFLWIYWMVRNSQIPTNGMTLPILGERQWNSGAVGPMRTWIVWYFLCSFSFNQLIRKSLNLQTTPDTS
ncbi:HTR-like protein [Halobacteriales archaeon QH_7_65_31]|nr:MAG: HTR-like protein [Halobacteriales archaeon QH_7_65_31]